MAEHKQRVPLAGSERALPIGSRVSGKLDLSETAKVTLILRPRPSSYAAMASALKGMSALMPRDRRYPTREEFAAEHGATPEQLAKVEAFAREYGLDIAEENAARRSVVLSGTLAQLSRAFGVTLKRYSTSGGSLPRAVRSHIPAR